MSLFENMTSEGHEKTQDRLGGPVLLDTGVHAATIKLAYLHKAQSGAQAIAFEFDVNGQTYRETMYITKATGENFYMKGKEKVGLPGFVNVDEICLCTTNKPLSKQATEERVLKLWDSEAKEEKPQGRAVLVELLEKPINLGIHKEKVAVQTKGPNGYVDVVEDGVTKTRLQNVTNKVFHSPTNLTVPEVRGGLKAGVFIEGWKKQNGPDKVVDRTGNSGKGGKAPGAPPSDGGGSGPSETPPLFG